MPHGVDAKRIDILDRIGRVAARLADLPPFVREKAVDDDLVGHRGIPRTAAVPASTPRETSTRSCRWRDTFRPRSRSGRRRVREAEPRQVVDERVDPHVDDLRRIAGERNAPPGRPRGVAGDRDVRKAASDEAQHLALARLRQNVHVGAMRRGRATASDTHSGERTSCVPRPRRAECRAPGTDRRLRQLSR